MVVSRAPTSTTNMTGFFTMMRGCSFAIEPTIARTTIFLSARGLDLTWPDVLIVPQKTFPAAMSRCSRIGPRLRAGKKVSDPTIKMVDTSRVANKAPVTGKVPTDSGTVFFLARFPAMAMIGMIMKKRPSNWATPVLVLYHMVLALIPAKAEPLFPADETYAYR